MTISANDFKLVFGTILSCLGVFWGYRRYSLKVGMRLRGGYGTTSTVACEESFVSRVVLENLKDRPVTIYGIYLRVGYNIYIVIEDFADKPLTLKAFETYQNDYDPIDYYSVGTSRIAVGKFLGSRKLKKRLVVSTSDGKYTVRQLVRRWDPVYDFFRNHMTSIVHPMRSVYKGKAYGSNTLYLVELTFEDGSEQIVPIFPRDNEVKRFWNLRLTAKSLESKEELEALLLNAKSRLAAKTIVVHDLQASRDERFEQQEQHTVKARPTTALEYYVLGYILTRLSNWRMRQENKKLAKQHQQSLHSAITPKTKLRITIIASIVGLVIPVWLLLHMGDAGFGPVRYLFTGRAFADRPLVTGGALDQWGLHKELFIFLVSAGVMGPFISLVRLINVNSPRIVRTIFSSTSLTLLVHPLSIITIFTYDVSRYILHMGVTRMRLAGLGVAVISYFVLWLFARWVCLAGLRAVK